MKIAPLTLRRLGTVAGFALAAGACDANQSSPGVEGPGFKIAVAPITLGLVTDACYSIANYKVTGLSPVGWDAAAHLADLVWSRTPVCASDFGIGTGAGGDVAASGIAYTGACDASVATNSVVLSLDGIYQGGHSPTSQSGASGAGTALTAGADYYNPCPASEPCILEAPCNPSEDTPVSFDLTVMRNGEKGFFDVSVQFKDIFCSAKFDCAYADGSPIRQVIGLDGEQKDTAVLGFACTAGTSGASHLYMSKLHLSCDGGVSQDIDPALSGNLFTAPHALPLGSAHPSDVVFQAVTSLGQLSQSAFTEYYWNVSLGIDLARANNCTLTARATATEGAFTDATFGSGLTPASSTYPYVEFEIPIGKTAGANPQLTCAANGGFRNKLNDTDNDSGVVTKYTSVGSRLCFANEYPGATVVGSVSDAASPLGCTHDIDAACIGKPTELTSAQLVFQSGVQVFPSSPVVDIDCLQTLNGSLILVGASPPPVTAKSFQHLETITGELTIQTSGDFSFPALSSLGRLNVVSGSTVNSFNVPQLASVSKVLLIASNFPNGISLGTTTITDTTDGLVASNSTFGGTGLRLPNLTSATKIQISGGSLAAFSAPNLATVTDTLWFFQNTLSGPNALSLPALTTVDKLTIQQSSFSSVSLPNLTTATRFFVVVNGGMTSLSAPQLNHVTGSNSSFAVAANPVLSSLDLSGLIGVTGTAVVRDNTVLPCSVAQAIRAQLTSPAPTSSDISPNDGICL